MSDINQLRQEYSHGDFVVPKYFNFSVDIIDDWARIEKVGLKYFEIGFICTNRIKCTSKGRYSLHKLSRPGFFGLFGQGKGL